MDKEGRISGVYREKRIVHLQRSGTGDEEGECTFTGGRGNTIIDYIIRDIKVRDRVIRTVWDKTNSDHHPMEVWLEKMVKRKKNVGKSRESGRVLPHWASRGPRGAGYAIHISALCSPPRAK